MVPYINTPYAEHILKLMGQDANAKASVENIDMLLKAAGMCQQLVRDLEKQDTIKGYIIFTEELPKEQKKEKEEFKDLIQESEPQKKEEDNKFKNKVLKEFVPIMLSQYEGEQYLEYDSFDQCVDEYFTQADKYRETSKYSNKETRIWDKMSKIKDD